MGFGRVGMQIGDVVLAPACGRTYKQAVIKKLKEIGGVSKAEVEFDDGGEWIYTSWVKLTEIQA